jgi:hypothetical protein
MRGQCQTEDAEDIRRLLLQRNSFAEIWQRSTVGCLLLSIELEMCCSFGNFGLDPIPHSPALI